MSNIERHTGSTSPVGLDEQMRYARAVAEAGLVPDNFRAKPANVLIAVDIAQSLGESTWSVMSEMSVIGGRPSFSAKFMRSRVRQAGHKLRETFKDGVARCVIIRSDDPDFEHTAEWDEAKARQHGLWDKGHWRKNSELMLKNRAVSECVREACYEVMGGIAYTPDEIVDFAGEAPSVRRESSRTPQQAPSSNHDKAAAALGIVDKPAETTPSGPRTLDDETFDKSLLWIESATSIDELERQKAKAAGLIPAQGKVITDIIDVRLADLRGDTLDAEVVDEPAA